MLLLPWPPLTQHLGLSFHVPHAAATPPADFHSRNVSRQSDWVCTALDGFAQHWMLTGVRGVCLSCLMVSVPAEQVSFTCTYRTLSLCVSLLFSWEESWSTPRVCRMPHGWLCPCLHCPSSSAVCSLNQSQQCLKLPEWELTWDPAGSAVAPRPLWPPIDLNHLKLPQNIHSFQ